MIALPVRVIKVGGSLLTFDRLPNAFRCWLDRQSLARNVAIVGGGELVDAIRAADTRFQLGDQACHQICLRAMSVTARLFATILQRHDAMFAASIVDELAALRPALETASHAELLVFDPSSFASLVENTIDGPPLPHTWNVTSDSIALRLTKSLGANELVLLKSNLPPSNLTAQDAAAGGFVDRHFPEIAGGARQVRYVNLRSEDACERELQR